MRGGGFVGRRAAAKGVNGAAAGVGRRPAAGWRGRDIIILHYTICRARGCVVSRGGHAGRNPGRCGGGGGGSERAKGASGVYARPGQQHPRKYVTSMTSAVPALTSLLTSIRSVPPPPSRARALARAITRPPTVPRVACFARPDTVAAARSFSATSIYRYADAAGARSARHGGVPGDYGPPSLVVRGRRWTKKNIIGRVRP